jgi:hypothetical protein
VKRLTRSVAEIVLALADLTDEPVAEIVQTWRAQIFVSWNQKAA